MNFKSLIVIPFFLLTAHLWAGSMTLMRVGAKIAAAGGAPTLVQSSCSATVNVTTLALQLTGIAVGNTLMGLYADTGETFSSISDGVNTYTNWSAGGSGNGSARAIIYTSTSVASGGTKTITVTTGTGATLNGCVAEFSGVTSFDVFKTAGTTGTNPTSGNFTTTGTTDLCAGIVSHSTSGTITLTPANTQIGEDENNTAHQAFNAQYKTVSSGTNTLTWTAISTAYVIDTVCFK